MKKYLLGSHLNSRKAPRGYLMILSLVFGAIFFTVLGALSTFSLAQNRAQINSEGRSKSLALAEATIEYYRWYLAHNPNDLKNGTGLPGPYSFSYNDPEGGLAGTASLAIVGNQSCGKTTSIELTATGATSDGSGAKRTIYARYAQPSIGTYAYLLNNSVWAGADRIINGPYHSNGGVRMDGTANSGVSSSLTTWTCTFGFGCSPDATMAGVFGSGTNPALWKVATPQVDFNGIAADFTSLKTTAQASGKYLPRISTGAGTASANSGNANYWNGYHLIFNADGTVTIKKVTSAYATALVGQINPIDPSTDYTRIKNESLFQTYTLPASCGLIFVEDNVWVEGIIPQKVTLVAANVTLPSITPNAILRNNITYTGANPGLTLIAHNDVLISADSASTLTLNGIFVAQTGSFGRNLYMCPSAYEPRTQLNIHGTTVSNTRTGTKWKTGCNNGASDAGYQTRIDGFDSVLATDPPVFTPVLTTDYKFVDWRDK